MYRRHQRVQLVQLLRPLIGSGLLLLMWCFNLQSLPAIFNSKSLVKYSFIYKLKLCKPKYSFDVGVGLYVVTSPSIWLVGSQFMLNCSLWYEKQKTNAKENHHHNSIGKTTMKEETIRELSDNLNCLCSSESASLIWTKDFFLDLL